MERALFLVVALITRAFNETAGTSIRTEDFTVRLHRAYRPLLSVVTASYQDSSKIVRITAGISLLPVTTASVISSLWKLLTLRSLMTPPGSGTPRCCLTITSTWGSLALLTRLLIWPWKNKTKDLIPSLRTYHEFV